MRPIAAALAAAGAIAAIGPAALSQAGRDSPRSGYAFLSPESQALQDDEFRNPGMLWVEQGREIWSDRRVPGGRSCADCHGPAEAAMRDAAARYPAYSPRAGRVINLEGQINQCRIERQGAPPFPYESQDLLAVTAFVANQARGQAISVTVDGPASTSFERGRAFFYTRRGQLDLACAHCHEQHVGDHLRGEPISQGQVNGFPIYRQLWQTLGSTHRMFAWCNEAIRAEPYPAGSQDYVDLELYEKWRANSLKIETPGIRR